MKKILLRVFILLAVLSALAYFIYIDYKGAHSTPAQDSGVTLKEPIPDLNKKWILPAGSSPEFERIVNLKIAELDKTLKDNSNQYDKWIELGILRKTVGDYKEAANIWEFASREWPDGLVAFNNLGDLYGFYLKDYSKAETDMRKVLAIDPHYVSGYRALYNLYVKLYGVKDPRTRGVLKLGLSANPEALDLKALLNQ